MSGGLSMQKRATGAARSGDDLVLVGVTLRAGRCAWETRVVEGFFGDGGAPGPVGVEGPVVLAVPTHAMLRREVEAPGQDVEELREALAENLGAFFPTPAEEALLWDAAPMSAGDGPARVWVGAVRAGALEPTLARMGESGAAPLRIVPSGLALALVRHLGLREGDEEVVERDGDAWSAHRYSGLSWSACRTGRGGAPGSGGRLVRWDSRADHEPEGEWGAASVALGAALCHLSAHTPPFNLFGRSRQRRLELPWWAGWAGAAAALVISSGVLADAMHARASAELRAVEAASARVGPEALRVDEMRARTARIRAIEARLAELERGYTARWRMLAALTGATPSDAWAERVEMYDTGFLMDLVATESAAQTLASLEQSPAFEQVRQSGQPTRAGERMRVRIDGQLERGGGGTP